MSFAESLLKIDGKLRSKLPEILPAWAFVRAYSVARDPILNFLSKERPQIAPPLFPVEFGGLTFRNDLGNAAGYDKNGDLLALNYLMGAGFGVIGTVLIKPNKGNHIGSVLRANPWTPLPASDGAMNSLGLPSKGVDYVVKNVDKFREEYQPVNFPIIASVMGHPEQEGKEKLEGTIKCVRRLLPYVDLIEINESCPNVGHTNDDEGLEYRLTKIVEARDNYRSISGIKVPLSVKLGSFGEISFTVEFMTKMEIDMLTGVNTQKNYAELRKKVHKKDLKIFDYYIRNYGGGVSGAIIQDFAHHEIERAAREIERQNSPLKLSHVGGIGINEDMGRSRNIGDVVVIREWYTLMMKAMANPLDEVYRNVVIGH